MRRRIELRPATPADEPFLLRVYAGTREQGLAALPEAMRATFTSQQYATQAAHYARTFPGAGIDVVLVDGRPAGRFYVWRGERETRIVDISLLPEHRGRGVGTALLRGVLDEGARVSLHVEHTNPARRLYERLGFTE